MNRTYNLMKILSGVDAEIIKYHQIAGGWYVELKDREDGQVYEMTVTPRNDPRVEMIMKEFDRVLNKIKNN